MLQVNEVADAFSQNLIMFCFSEKMQRNILDSKLI